MINGFKIKSKQAFVSKFKFWIRILIEHLIKLRLFIPNIYEFEDLSFN